MNRLILIAEHVRSMPWSTTAWVPRLAHALAAQGRHVHILCDGVEDPAIFEPSPFLTVTIRRPLRRLRSADPLGFAAWARQQLAGGQRALGRCDPTLSFTHYVPGDLWIPQGQRVLHALARSLRAHRPATALMEVLHRPWALQALLAERNAAALARGSGARLFRLGAPAVAEQRTARATAFLGLASGLPSLPERHRRALRDQVRASLGLSQDALVLATSAVHADRDGLAQMLAGVASFRASCGADARLLLLGRKTHTLARLRDRACLNDRAHILGATRHMREVLAAADLALIPAAQPDPRSTGRFLADALRCGTAVIASPAAAGSSLLRADATAPAAGLILDSPSPAAWQAALLTAQSPAWRAIASAQAATVGRELAIDAVAGRILALLAAHE